MSPRGGAVVFLILRKIAGIVLARLMNVVKGEMGPMAQRNGRRGEMAILGLHLEFPLF
jgi:hypothetical protein